MLDLRDKLDEALKAMVFAGAAAVATVVALFFCCVALFVWTQNHYGTVTACIVLAIIFFLAAIASLLLGWILRQRAKERRQRAHNRAQWWTDPTIITAALEIYRTLGRKRLATALIGALVVGVLVSRSSKQPTSPSTER